MPLKPLKTPAERRAWLRELNEPQIRALAAQHKTKGWRTKTIRALISALEVIKEIEVPAQA